ncbi:MAG: hypothetical protein MUP81_01370 [Dehalococcoidia bacterium]|nr:hypothetical protein [Dehalococcoidia bacterium]
MANKDFIEFQKKFREYQQQFGLTGYKVYFKYEPIVDHSFADITITQVDMVATVRLNSALEEKDKPFKHIGRSAKHEAVHLLLARLENRADNRFATADEIYEAVEELARKLEELIK